LFVIARAFCFSTSISDFRIFTKYLSFKNFLTIAQLRPLDLYTHAQTYVEIAKLYFIDTYYRVDRKSTGYA